MYCIMGSLLSSSACEEKLHQLSEGSVKLHLSHYLSLRDLADFQTLCRSKIAFFFQQAVC